MKTLRFKTEYVPKTLPSVPENCLYLKIISVVEMKIEEKI